MQSITRKLEHLRHDIEEDTIDRVIIRQWEEMDNYREYIYLLRNAMRVSNTFNLTWEMYQINIHEFL